MAKSKSETKQQIAGNDACVYMHTALRKVCDSPMTTAAYNLIHMLCAMEFHPSRLDPWRMFGQLVADRVNKGENPAKAAKAANEQLDDVFSDEFCKVRDEKKERLDEDCRTAMYTLHSVFRCFNDAEWERMTHYLNE
jgi:hypothetical protein